MTGRRTLSRALRFAEIGFHVFPIRKIRRDKDGNPCWPGTGDELHPRRWATSDPKTLRGMDWGGAWIGVDPAKSRLLVVDLDRHGKHDGPATWERWTKRNTVADAPSQTTPRNGYHLFFRARVPASRICLGGVDLLGKGSVTIDGPGYDWERSPFRAVFPIAPRWLQAITVCDRQRAVAWDARQR